MLAQRQPRSAAGAGCFASRAASCTHQHAPPARAAPARTAAPRCQAGHSNTTQPLLSDDAAASALLRTTPPPSYSHKDDILGETQQIVSSRYPQLLDLVGAGNLVVYQRPPEYVERRTDGYLEPQLIFILGTAHVSQASADEVARLVAAVQPDAVVVELCKSRSAVLQVPAGDELQTQQQARQQQWRQQYEQRRQLPSQFGDASSSSEEEEAVQLPAPPSGSTSSSSTSSSSSWWSRMASSQQARRSRKAANPLSLSGADPLSALARSAALGGQNAMLLRLLLSSQARQAAESLGVQPGAEFRAAAVAAAAVDGGSCCLVLGDRPIEITLQRAWDALSWRRRLQLVGDLLSSARAMTAQGSAAGALTQEQVEAMRSDDAVSALFGQLSARFPELVAPLITERDLYLSWSLKRSKAVCGAAAVVGVVGKGHLRGIVYALKNDAGQQLRFKDLVGGMNSRKNRQAAAAAAARRLLLELLLGAGAWAAWVAATAQQQ